MVNPSQLKIFGSIIGLTVCVFLFPPLGLLGAAGLAVALIIRRRDRRKHEARVQNWQQARIDQPGISIAERAAYRQAQRK